MKMKHLLLFLMVCQCKRESDMRPTDLPNEFKLVQSFTSEMSITLNGTMESNTNVLFLSLSDGTGTSVCNVTYDAVSKTATMQSELSKRDLMEYNTEHDPTVPARFWLEIQPRVMDQQHLIQLHFEVESAGPLTFEACKIKDFENVHLIVVEGADSVTSLLFTLSK